MRSMVEGALGADASRYADAPSTTLLRRVVPLPRFAGQDFQIGRNAAPGFRCRSIRATCLRHHLLDASPPTIAPATANLRSKA